jgi:hypothetical protein
MHRDMKHTPPFALLWKGIIPGAIAGTPRDRAATMNGRRGTMRVHLKGAHSNAICHPQYTIAQTKSRRPKLAVDISNALRNLRG